MGWERYVLARPSVTEDQGGSRISAGLPGATHSAAMRPLRGSGCVRSRSAPGGPGAPLRVGFVAPWRASQQWRRHFSAATSEAMGPVCRGTQQAVDRHQRAEAGTGGTGMDASRQVRLSEGFSGRGPMHPQMACSEARVRSTWVEIGTLSLDPTSSYGPRRLPAGVCGVTKSENSADGSKINMECHGRFCPKIWERLCLRNQTL